MANYATSKQTFANQMQDLVGQLLRLADQMDDLNAAYSVHGFNSGGANEFVDGDFDVQNTHLTATIVADVMFAIGTIDGDMSTGIRNSLRECLVGGLP
jgi:hypothetical protein